MAQNLGFIALIISALALGLGAFALYKMLSINKLKDAFFEGKNAGNLEDLINRLDKNQKTLLSQQQTLDKDLQKLHDHLLVSIQKVGLVRFNPFSDGGGNFSFCAALLDFHNNGFVITSMHGREQNRIYAKKITSGNADSAFTEEEQQAVEQAISKHSEQLQKISNN